MDKKRSRGKEEADSDIEFEDPYEDEFEEEEEDAEFEMEDEEEQDEPPVQVWWPTATPPDGTKMDYESGVYDMLHELQVDWPCLSFDFIHDSLGFQRKRFPMTLHLIAGSQANENKENKLLVMKFGQLCKTKHDMDSDDEEEDDTFDLDPVLAHRAIPHLGAVNRIRSMPQKPHIVCSWSETGKVFAWDISKELASLDKAQRKDLSTNTPIQTFEGHTTEGYALDWSPTSEGRLASGDCVGRIHIWEPRESGWGIGRTPYYDGRENSVEDIQWSPTENTVFASCGTDKSLKIWDTRVPKKPAIQLENAHSNDINVISWNKLASHVLLSGGDDSAIKVWDCRQFGPKCAPTANFSWHHDPICSVEWDPNNESCLAAASDDGRVSFWDLSVEADSSHSTYTGKEEIVGLPNGTTATLPDQLLFVHQTRGIPKEVHFHPQIPASVGVTTSNGIQVFIPSNLTE